MAGFWLLYAGFYDHYLGNFQFGFDIMLSVLLNSRWGLLYCSNFCLDYVGMRYRGLCVSGVMDVRC